MPLKCARRKLFSSKKHVFLGLTPVYSETTALIKPYFILKRRSVRKFLRKRLLSRNKKLLRPVTMALKTLYQKLWSLKNNSVIQVSITLPNCNN